MYVTIPIARQPFAAVGDAAAVSDIPVMSDAAALGDAAAVSDTGAVSDTRWWVTRRPLVIPGGG